MARLLFPAIQCWSVGSERPPRRVHRRPHAPRVDRREVLLDPVTTGDDVVASGRVTHPRHEFAEHTTTRILVAVVLSVLGRGHANDMATGIIDELVESTVLFDELVSRPLRVGLFVGQCLLPLQELAFSANCRELGHAKQ